MKKHNGRKRQEAPLTRRNPKPFFEVGQRVVCIDATPNHLAPDARILVAGKIDIIRAIDLGASWKWPWWGVHLEGVQIFYPGKSRRRMGVSPSPLPAGYRTADGHHGV